MEAAPIAKTGRAADFSGRCRQGLLMTNLLWTLALHDCLAAQLLLLLGDHCAAACFSSGRPNCWNAGPARAIPESLGSPCSRRVRSIACRERFSDSGVSTGITGIYIRYISFDLGTSARFLSSQANPEQHRPLSLKGSLIMLKLLTFTAALLAASTAGEVLAAEPAPRVVLLDALTLPASSSRPTFTVRCATRSPPPFGGTAGNRYRSPLSVTTSLALVPSRARPRPSTC